MENLYKNFIVTCPECDTEYFAGEIYIPKYLLGQPTTINKDIVGKIVDWDGLDPDVDEVFTCTRCGKQFKVHADIHFSATSIAEFSDEYVTKKYSDRLFLSED